MTQFITPAPELEELIKIYMKVYNYVSFEIKKTDEISENLIVTFEEKDGTRHENKFVSQSVFIQFLKQDHKYYSKIKNFEDSEILAILKEYQRDFREGNNIVSELLYFTIPAVEEKRLLTAQEKEKIQESINRMENLFRRLNISI